MPQEIRMKRGESVVSLFFYMTDCRPFLSNISCNSLLETKFFPMKIGLPVPLPDCGGLLLPGPGHLLERRIQGVLGHLGVRQRNQGRLRIVDKSSWPEFWTVPRLCVLSHGNLQTNSIYHIWGPGLYFFRRAQRLRGMWNQSEGTQCMNKVCIRKKIRPFSSIVIVWPSDS